MSCSSPWPGRGKRAAESSGELQGERRLYADASRKGPAVIPCQHGLGCAHNVSEKVDERVLVFSMAIVPEITKTKAVIPWCKSMALCSLNDKTL